MKLTEHFSLEEFEYSSTALAKGIDNHIPLNGQPSNGGTHECGSSSNGNVHPSKESGQPSNGGANECGSCSNGNVHPSEESGRPSNGGANECGSEILENIRSLCETILEPLRQHAGIPIQLNSGYRCPALNRAVGGSSQSQHLKGEAADIRVPDPQTGEAWFRWMRDHLPFDQLIKERSSRTSPSFWIHVSHRRTGSNRRQVIGDLIKSI